MVSIWLLFGRRRPYGRARILGHGRGTGSAVEVQPEVQPEVERSVPEVCPKLARSCSAGNV